MLVPTRPWDEILRMYRKLEQHHAGFTPMRQLVEHIASQPYGSLLFATTSMHALLVVQHRELEWGHDVLRVECDPDQKTAMFSYQEQAFVKPTTWECPIDRLVETFDGFLRRSGWVSLAHPK